MHRLRITATTTTHCSDTTSVAVDPDDDARVIVNYANCSTEKVELWLNSDDAVVLDLKNRGINTILSIPRNTELLDLSWNNELSAPLNLSLFPSLTSIYLRGCNLTNLQTITWPPLLTELNLRDNQLRTLTTAELPPTLRKLKLSDNSLTSLDTVTSLPNLRILVASQNQITSIQTLPLLLQQLDVSGNHLTTLTNLDLPPSLMRLNLSSNVLQLISNVRFPPSLRELDLRGNAIETFNIDQRDLVSLRESTTIYSSPYDWGVSASICGSSAILNWVQRSPLCVVPSTIVTLGSNSPSLAPFHEVTPDNKGSQNSITNGSGSLNVTLASTVGAIVILVILVGLSVMALFKRRQPIATPAKGEQQDPEAGLSRSHVNASSNLALSPSQGIDISEASQSSNSTCNTPSSLSFSSSSSSSLELSLSSSTMELDSAFLQNLGLTLGLPLIPRSTWIKHHVLSQSSNQGTEVIIANYTKEKAKGSITKSIHKQLVIKQLTSTAPDAVLAFREEVRTCAQLHHASLVPFLGVTTTVFNEPAYVCEYLPTGDLATVLNRQRPNSRKVFTWLASDLPSNPPTPSELGTSKLELLLELVDGLRYLHSQEPPLVHQRLDSSAIIVWSSSQSRRHRSNSTQRRSLACPNRSVLQLSLFGITRAPTQHERMANTSMGTPWVAPEVLKGAPCDVRANIYSLGVIMTELDTCERPYHSGIEGFLPPQPSNAKIAIMVSAGSVQPRLHEDCPSKIRTLIKQCLSYEPEDRPTLSEVAQQLMMFR